MTRLIDGDALTNTLQKLFDKREKEQMFTGSREPCVTWNDVIYHIKSAPTVDAVPVCRCAECKHRPTKPEKYDDGFDLTFPDEVCPCYCDGDPYYSWYPKDDWFCPKGERKGQDER